jgi:hypothetical protein
MPNGEKLYPTTQSEMKEWQKTKKWNPETKRWEDKISSQVGAPVKEKPGEDLGLLDTSAPGEIEKKDILTRGQGLLDNLLGEGEEGEKVSISEKPIRPTYEETYKGLRGEYEVAPLEQELSEIEEKISQTESFYERRVAQEKEGVSPAGVIAGRQARLTGKKAQELRDLERRKSNIINQLTLKNATISNIMNLKQLDYSSARAEYEFEWNKSYQIAQWVRGEEKEEENRAQANWATMTTMISDVIKTGGGTYAGLPELTKLDLQKMETQMGLPSGFSEWALGNINPDKKVQTTIISDDKTQVSYVYSDGTIDIVSTGLSPQEGDLSQSEKTVEAVKDMSVQIESVKGSDGYVSPENWKKAKDVWRNEGFKPEDFIKNFYTFINPSRPSDYGSRESNYLKGQEGGIKIIP